MSSKAMEESLHATKVDSIAWFLKAICREPLLTPAEEIELGNKIQTMNKLMEKDEGSMSEAEKTVIKQGKKAKDRMMKANLRLVVSIAKKYQGKGLDLLDLVQEGSIGLERAVDKFDATRGYKFSTYAFWWIRQSMTRALAIQSRSIRLPIHLNERLSLIRKATQSLTHQTGSMPSRDEIADAIKVSRDELESILRQTLTVTSLDEPVSQGDGKSSLVDLIADNRHGDPLERVEFGIHKEQLEKWLEHLGDVEREIIAMRFGLEDFHPLTLSEIGKLKAMSRERVRQIELKALRKLRALVRKFQIPSF